MTYTYFERDYFNNCGSYPMSQSHYEALLQTCFTYSSHFSFCISNFDHILTTALEKWKLDVKTLGVDTRLVYKACEDTKEILQSYARSVFEFSRYSDQGGPEDLTFYREDDSVFMESVGHEGECSIYPQENEDVSSLLRFGRWLPCDNQGRPEIPAKTVQLSPLDKTNIHNDPFYKKLCAIRQQPNVYLQEKSIEVLTQWIETYWPESFGLKPPHFPNDINVLPTWYFVFKMDVLAKYDQLTTATILQAIYSEKCSAAQAFDCFFDLLDGFLTS